VKKLLIITMLLTIVAAAQQPINLATVAGTAPSTAGKLDIKAANGDVFVQCSTAANCPVNATETGTWSVRNQDAAGNGITTNSTTFTAKFAWDTNLLGTLGTAFSTAGKVDVKAADGDVFVRSTTAANFLANVTLQAGANIAGKFDLLGNAGAIMDAAGQNASSPANELLIGGQFNTSPTTITSGNMSPLQLSSAGSLLVQCTSGCSATTAISLIPQTTGGLTLSHTVSAATTNATSLKATAGQVYEACVNSNAAYPVFFKLYNKASAPTVGTDTPVKVLQAQAGVPACMRTEEGFAFATGIAWALTKGITDADATAVAASDGTVEIAYK